MHFNRAASLWDCNHNIAGAAIQDEEDHGIFFDDFNGGEWYGVSQQDETGKR